MNRNKFTKNALQVMISRAVMLVSEILLGFVVPKILGVTGYGYFKTYALYTVYSAFLHFGFVDGILLNFAGQNYDSLDKKRMRTNTIFFIYLELVVSFLLVLGCLFLFPNEMRFIGIMFSMNTFVINVTSYYQYISQAMQRFKELSFRNILIAISKIILVICFLLIFNYQRNYVSYRLYIVFVNIIEIALMSWYVYTYRDITFGNRYSILSCKDEIKHLFTSGISLTIAYQVSHLVFQLDRQFVSILYSAEIFAIYSFAYNLISVCTKMISSLSTVLFPMLKQMNVDSAMKYYSKSISLMLLLSGIILSGYFPLTEFVEWYLPAYSESLVYLRIILPALLLSSCITVIMFTFYKVLDKNIVYFKISCIVLVISIVLNYLAYVIFGTTISISWATVISMNIWFLLGQFYFVKNYKIEWKRNFIYIISLIGAFYVISYVFNVWYVGMIYFVFLYIILSYVFFKNTYLLALLIKQ